MPWLILAAAALVLLVAKRADASIARSAPAGDAPREVSASVPVTLDAEWFVGPTLPSNGVVPRISIPANPGQNPKVPPVSMFQDPRFRPYIERAVRDVNQAAMGLRIGLNSWWRPAGSVGEELSQHHIGAAVDIQGPDQDIFATRIAAKGWTVLRQANDGSAYRHIHAQQERAGLLTRIGVTSKDIARFA